MTDSTENATFPKSTNSKNSNSSVQIQIKSKPQFEFVLREIEKSEFLDLVNFRGYSMVSGKRLILIAGLTNS